MMSDEPIRQTHDNEPPTSDEQVAGPTAGEPESSPPPGAYPPPPSPSAEAAGSLAGPRPSPFAGVPIRDYVTDAAALILLCVSFGLGWDFEHRASERIEVVLITVLSLMSLSLFYLARAGVFPPDWTGQRVSLVRALANVPYVVLVGVYVVLDAIAAFDDGGVGGLGPAVGLGLAGALLAAVPRAAELAEPSASALQGVWRRLIPGLLGAILVVQALGLVNYLVDLGDALDFSGGWAHWIAAIVSLLTLTAVAGWALFGEIRRDGPWRWIVVAVGATAAFYLLILNSLWDGLQGPFQAVTSIAQGDAALVFLPAAAALVLTAVVSHRATHADAAPHGPWLATASRAWQYVVLVAGGVAIALLFRIIANGVSEFSDGVPVWQVIVMVLLFVIGVAGLVAHASLRNNPVTGRPVALAATAAIAVLGLVVLIVTASNNEATPRLGLWDFLLAFSLPAVAFAALLGPASVRDYYAAHTPRGPAAGQPPAAESPASEGRPFTAEQASDGLTDPAVLAEIAQEAPELRPYVASNPATYPELLEWLAELNDPAVDAALAARPKSPQSSATDSES